MLYDGMRAWRASTRKEIAHEPRSGSDPSRKIAADALVRRLYKCGFYLEPGGARLVENQVTDIIAGLIGGLRPSLRRDFTSPLQDVQKQARRTAALLLAEGLEHFWILRDSPPTGFPFPDIAGGIVEPLKYHEGD